MASWTASYRPEAIDRDTSFYWHSMDNSPQGEMPNDFFGQFVDFDGGAHGTATSNGAEDFHGGHVSMPTMPDSLLMDHISGSTASSGASSADEFDFLSGSSHIGQAMSSASQEVDPKNLNLGNDPQAHGVDQFEYFSRGSMSDTELSRLEGISLYSPQKNISASHPASPTPPNTGTQRKQNRFVEAVSSTIRKATNMRKTRKALPKQRAESPTMETTPQEISPRKTRGRAVTQAHKPVSPTRQSVPNEVSFIHGYCDDPFNDMPAPPPAQQFIQSGAGSPMEAPRVKTNAVYQAQHGDPMSAGSWSQQSLPSATCQQWVAPDYMSSQGQDSGWWDAQLMNQNNELVDPKNASVNMAMHSHQAELPYDYSSVPDSSTGGLMIHMPQPRQAQQQPAVAHGLPLNEHTYLPPHPAPPPVPATERPHRPPRAPSSGARHMSRSPMRKTRGPSASPTPHQPSQAQSLPRSRHSSGGSISSVRSASGRLPGSMPGTPCSVRKRRSRDVSGSGSVSEDLGGGVGLGGGFVNFTPHDGTMLMTGVAPSGSSKTKARREKEASDRRRRLSEAAMKAVAAAGGDVDKLIEQGFTF